MNINKKKKIIIIFIVLVLLIFIPLIIKFFKDDSNVTNENLVDDYTFNFGETLNLEETNGAEEYETRDTGTDYFGTLDEYDESKIIYEGDKILVQTFEGYKTISTSWSEEGKATLIEPPEFGELEKFIEKKDSISVKYRGVEINDIDKYIKVLSDNGFYREVLNNKNKKKDYFYYTAEKADGSVVSLNYREGELYINVY